MISEEDSPTASVRPNLCCPYPFAYHRLPALAMALLDKVQGDEALYIGGIFSLRRKDALKQANITHVLSVLRMPLDKELFAPYKHIIVEVDDVEDENLLEHFPTTNGFIQEGLDNGGGVLVHCAMGKSRSATCVIAYLIQRHRLTPQEALEHLQRSRSICEPNPGFMEQLELYHQMQAPFDIDNEPAYQRWLYKREVDLSIACGKAPEKVRFEDEQLSTTGTGRDESTADIELRCRKCRRQLATSQYIVKHKPMIFRNDQSDGQPIVPPPCSHYFLDPLSWMKSELEEGKLDGRLECPRCKTNVGRYAWQGMRCSCSEWIVPGISLARGKVDEVRLRPLTVRDLGANAQPKPGLGPERRELPEESL